MKTTKEAKHSEIPWNISEVIFDKKEWDSLHNKEDICLGRGVEIIAIVYGKTDAEQKENAVLIRNAVNNYDRGQEIKRELLDMLQAVLPCVEESDEFNKPSHKQAPLVRALIAKTEEAVIQNAKKPL